MVTYGNFTAAAFYSFLGLHFQPIYYYYCAAQEKLSHFVRSCIICKTCPFFGLLKAQHLLPYSATVSLSR